MGVNALPDLLVSVDVEHVAVLGQLELRSDPLGVQRHAEAQVHTVLDRHLDQPAPFVNLFNFTLCWWLPFLPLSFFSFRFFPSLTLSHLLLSLFTLNRLDNARRYYDVFFVHPKFDLLASQFLIILVNFTFAAHRSEDILHADILPCFHLLPLLLAHLLFPKVEHDFPNILFRTEHVWLPFTDKTVKARWQMQHTFIVFKKLD